MKVTLIPIVIGALGTKTGGLVNKGTSWDYPNYRIIKIGQNTKKSPGRLEETCNHSNSSKKTSANDSGRNSQIIINFLAFYTGSDL